MTHGFKLLLIAACWLTVVCLSCRSNEDTVATPVTTVGKEEALSYLKTLKTPSQSFTVTAGVSRSILGKEGTLIKFYPNSFKDRNGTIITSGTVNIELTELYKVGDMVANRTSTTTANGVLTSGGEVNIKATMAGEEVFANKYGLGFKSEATLTLKPMELYYGDAENADSVVVWETQKGGAGSTLPGVSYISDSAVLLWERAYYMFDTCTSFNWINCDHPYDGTSQYVTVNIKLQNNAPISEASYPSLFVVFSSANIATLLPITNYNSGNHTMKFEGRVPTGSVANLVFIIPKSKNEYYYYEQSGTVSNGMSINANISSLTSTELIAKMKEL
jgi:hypothetical protein